MILSISGKNHTEEFNGISTKLPKAKGMECQILVTRNTEMGRLNGLVPRVLKTAFAAARRRSNNGVTEEIERRLQAEREWAIEQIKAAEQRVLESVYSSTRRTNE